MIEYHPLPIEAQQHLEQITYDATRQHVADRIQKLHLIENLPRRQTHQEEVADFSPQFIADSERVRHHMGVIAEQASAVHAELSATQGTEVSTADVWNHVLERQLVSASEAKQQGDSEAATRSLVDYLITTELNQSDDNSFGWNSLPEAQEEKIAKALDEAIAHGLAPELVEAARQSHGLVHIEDESFGFDEFGSLPGYSSQHIKVTSIAHTIETVKPQLEIVIDRTISLDPEDPALGEKLIAEAAQERVEQLSLESAAAAAKGVVLAEQRNKGGESDTIDHLTTQALRMLTKRTWTNEDKAESLIRLGEANPSLTDPSKYESEFRAIREMRMVNSYYRINRDEIYPVDQALVNLWDRGFKDVAGRILTAGNEITERDGHFGGAISHLVGQNPKVAQEIQAEVQRRQQKCTQKLEAALMSPDNDADHYSRYSPEHINAESLMHKVMATQDPERSTDLVLNWAKNNSTEKILSTLRLMDNDPDSGYGPDLMLILTGKENPVLDLDEINQVMTVVSELSQRHYFPKTIARDSALLDASEQGRELRARVAMLHNEFPLDLFGNLSYQKSRFFERVFENNDPHFINNVKALLETPVFGSLQGQGVDGAGDVALKLLSGVVNAKNTGQFLEEQSGYLQSLKATIDHSLYAQLKRVKDGEAHNAFNAFLLSNTITAGDPSRAITNLNVAMDGELMSSLRKLYKVAPADIINDIVADALSATDINRFIEESQDLAAQLKAVTEHPLMDLLRPGEMLHNIAPVILNGMQLNDNKVAFCERTYAAFTKPQPLWKGLTRLTELLIGQKIENLGTLQSHVVKDIPFLRIKLGVSPENADLEEIEGFKPHSFAGLTIEQKRMMTSDQLAGLSDEQVSGLQNLTFDRFTDRVKRVLFAYQLQQTVERSRDGSKKEEADSRNQLLASQGVTMVREGDFVHATAFDSLSSILQDGNVAGEARGTSSAMDRFPYNVDFGVISGGETVQQKIEDTISFRHYGNKGSRGESGQILLVYKRTPTSWMSGQETFPNTYHGLIFGGIPSTEITGIVLSDPSSTLANASRTVVENGFYVPLYDKQGAILFTPDQYQRMKDDLNMQVQIPPENIIDSSLKAENQKGVTEGGLYLFPTEAGPERYYVKFAENPDHTWTEYAADELYRAAGIGVPDTRVVKVEGRLGRASRWVEEGSELPPSESSTLEDGAAMDMLLANWDVVYNSKNTLTVNGKVLRPDSGSALDMWATGIPKRAGTWIDEVRELNSGTNKSRLWEGMRQEYPQLTNEQLKTQVRQIQTRLTDEVIDSIIDSIRRPQQARTALKARLKARRDNMVAQVLGVARFS